MLERSARGVRGLANASADATRGFYRVLGGPGRFLQDFMNGVWLGHSLHAALVDVVVGGSTAALALDLLRVAFGVDGLEDATFWVLALSTVSAVGAIATGLTDFKDTSADTATRDVTYFHGLINILASIGFTVSTVQRANGDHDLAFWVLLVAYAVITLGAFIGGHVVYKYGYSVNYNGLSRGARAPDFKPIMALAELPEGAPTKASLGATSIMLVRRGEVVHALKETCSHLGGPLSKGELHGDTITCPWHQSVFRITDGSVVHGPATSRQVFYRTRIGADGQVEVQGPHD